MRKRLRPAHTPEQLARIYATPHDHTLWRDHVIRIDATIDVAKKFIDAAEVRSAGDLSCGSGAVLKALDVEELHLGDYAAGYRYTGPIEDTIHEIPAVDLFVCTETVEHVNDPDQVLRDIRGKTSMLVLSTPVDNWDDTNIEHYWAWSEADVEQMLAGAGFEIEVQLLLDFRRHGPEYYAFTIVGCR